MSKVIYETNIQRKRLLFRGKVRDTYRVRIDGCNYLFVVSTDRVSAFDKVLPNPIPGKGKVLNLMSLFWFEQTKSICLNQLFCYGCNTVFPIDCLRISREQFIQNDLGGRWLLAEPLKMLPVECVVRGYLAGSAWGEYKETNTINGQPMPLGLKESQKLPAPLFTPTTKAKTGHDEPLDWNRLVALVGNVRAGILKYYSLQLYAQAAAFAIQRGIIIADTKFEFGINKGARIVLADEVLTPDSSRLWDAKTYEPGRSQPSFDKQPLRDWLSAHNWKGEGPAPQLSAEIIRQTSQRYLEAYRRLVGESLPM